MRGQFKSSHNLNPTVFLLNQVLCGILQEMKFNNLMGIQNNKRKYLLHGPRSKLWETMRDTTTIQKSDQPY